jgi:Leucine-rich repeat (LRR) protein
VGLNLSNNRMLSLSSIQEMVTQAPNVTALNLSRNQLRAMEELDKLKGWQQLTEIILDKNPMCDRFASKAKAEYIRYPSLFSRVT